MKNQISSTLCRTLTCCFIPVLLMSYHHKPKNETRLNHNHNTSDIEKVADNVFNDPVYKLIYKKDVQNIIFQTSNNSLMTDNDKLKELSKKSKFSENEINYIISTVWGFKNQNDFNNYIGLYRYLIKKYGINKFSKSDQEYFFNALRNKEIEYTGKLVELSKNRSKLDSLNKLYSGPGGIRPECWKCIYDYQACLNPIVGVQTWTSESPISSDIIQLSIYGGAWHTYSVTVFNDNSANRITYTDPATQSSPCTDVFKSCISQCNQP